jgi:hypothetical protein
MTTYEGYKVVGHVNPVGAYPAYVIPVTRMEGQDYAIYLSENDLIDLRLISGYVKHPPRTLSEEPPYCSERLRSRLFAFNQHNSVLYGHADVLDFWSYAVNHEQILEIYPFPAIDIAVDTRLRGCIITALAASVRVLSDSRTGKAFIDNWYNSQISELKQEFAGELVLPELWTELQAETLLLHISEMAAVSIMRQTAKEFFSRRDLVVHADRLEGRESRRLIDTLLELTADICIEHDQVVAWHAFFDFYVLKIDPAAIARRLSLRGIAAVQEEANKAMSVLLNVVAREKARNPVLSGLTEQGVRTVLASSRVFARPQGMDIVFCIDVTGSMEPFIEATKGIVSRFHEALVEGLKLRGLTVSQARARVVAFRDYFCDQEPMRQTSFMLLPQEEWALRSIVRGLAPEGGGDDPESSLEALAIAMDSEWVSGGSDSGHVIMLFTDAPAHALEESSKRYPVNYPTDLPRSLSELRAKWDHFCATSRAAVQRIVLFAPNAYPWTEIGHEWPNTIHIVSSAGDGLKGVPEDLIVESIARGLD